MTTRHHGGDRSGPAGRDQAPRILDIPVGTAKSRLHHGLTALRRTVRDETVAPTTQVEEGAR